MVACCECDKENICVFFCFLGRGLPLPRTVRALKVSETALNDLSGQQQQPPSALAVENLKLCMCCVAVRGVTENTSRLGAQ